MLYTDTASGGLDTPSIRIIVAERYTERDRAQLSSPPSNASDTSGCAVPLFALLRMDRSIAWLQATSVTNGGIYCVPP